MKKALVELNYIACYDTTASLEKALGKTLISLHIHFRAEKTQDEGKLTHCVCVCECVCTQGIACGGLLSGPVV